MLFWNLKRFSERCYLHFSGTIEEARHDVCDFAVVIEIMEITYYSHAPNEVIRVVLSNKNLKECRDNKKIPTVRFLL
jgi:hypothetical protein